ncbi:PIG-L family deacetylase [Gymnodinialimonas ceratoperidinii]|uniref:PIG-L family deacetylase n=1 Tax=Gymnodinialimonas ceratoperidinii TaxID=2856823 RepID=A0A8F6TSL9_9RHOB|nr:PIG-L family deacetylase [Gymnodinialimonas ceratoperidinii]QXT38216.1 PIG-L family deacetylase [Gymnodinialimonas ceratoperidinii]
MSNAVQSRILSEAGDPLIARVWRAMAGLRSVVGFMNTGAHPDDETSAMLAALWLRDGVNLSYACSTRGEGGQNDIGTEAGPALGALRTAEMERACDVLDMVMYWHGQSPDDTITDFRFSKSGKETMGIWGRERLLQRFVEIVRTERPDILCPTFLDIPGQHGHHRAMTEAAHAVIDLAADPDFPCDLPVWQVSKLYLPAFSGAGGAYDDEVPPPPATLTVAAKGGDEMLGMSYERIGQWSRQFHRTQGMGRWFAPGDERDWPLHLAWSRVGEDAGAVTDNLPQTLADIGLPDAQSKIDEMLAAFPNFAAMARLGAEAFQLLTNGKVAEEHSHRVTRKRQQLARLVQLVAGVSVRARPEQIAVSPGASVPISFEVREGISESVDVSLEVPDGMTATGDSIKVSADAAPTDPYPDTYAPLSPRAPAVRVVARLHDTEISAAVPMEEPLLVLPEPRATLSRKRAFLNLSQPARDVSLSVHAKGGAFDLPEGFEQRWEGDEVTLTVPDNPLEGMYDLPLKADGKQAFEAQVLTHEHIRPTITHSPATLSLRLAEVALPRGRIAYIGAGNDRIAPALQAAGIEVTDLSDADLARAEPFAGFDTILVGVFAHRFRPALQPVVATLNAWVKDGGTLVTLYHRPWDNWRPDTTPPAMIEIGQPSLRWRITDAEAEVTVLAPEHRVFSGPNPIGPEDWNGWKKERGLYFAKAWDAAYTPLLRMADPDEQPLDGGLLVGEIGQGCHAHVALNLHHQLEHLVPGAYRLMANILDLRGGE